jgi:hypothetical protein
MEYLVGFVVGAICGILGAALYLHSHEAKFVAAVASAYGKTVAEVAALKAKV